MKPFVIILAFGLGIGCLAAAAWLGNQSASKKNAAEITSTHDLPAAPKSDYDPKIAPHGPHPKAVIDETEFNFGTMLHGSKGSHVFVIRNEGEAPLELVARKEDRTCQCTGATLASDEPVPPGGQIDVKVEWEIRADNANFRHSAKIRTNDPEHKIIELVVMGTVEKSFQFSPGGAQWELGEVAAESATSSTKAMYSQATDFEIQEAVCANPRIKCTWEPLDAMALAEFKARCGYMLHLDVDLKDFSGVLNEELDLKTTAKEGAVAVLHVKARRTGPLELIARNWDPVNNRLNLGEFPANQGKKAEINVYARVPEEVKLLSAESEHQAVNVSWEKDEQFQGKSNTKRYRLKIEVPPGESAQRRRTQAEKVNLKFDHPEIGTLQILVDYLSL
jgi:hypothetical protein